MLITTNSGTHRIKVTIARLERLRAHLIDFITTWGSHPAATLEYQNLLFYTTMKTHPIPIDGIFWPLLRVISDMTAIVTSTGSMSKQEEAGPSDPVQYNASSVAI
jgi:hypothetical protein